MLNIFAPFCKNGHLTLLLLAATLVACSRDTVLLNSERIEQKYGSYGIELLPSAADERRSNLYSITSAQKTCRTYALVQFMTDPDASFSALHADVLAGQSLGRVFKSNGWAVQKQSLYFGSLPVSKDDQTIFALMRLDSDSSLAMHVYRLLIEKDGEQFEYATIVEAHHPDYLTENELLKIYQHDPNELLSDDAITPLIQRLRRTNHSH